MLGRLICALYVFYASWRLWEVHLYVFYVSWRLWEAHLYVFYVSWRLWEAHLYVFYVPWRLLGVLDFAGLKGKCGSPS